MESPKIDDISEDFRIRPRDRERLLKILESQDEDGNARFLDDREIVTHAIEVFLTWELEPEKIMDELKKIKMTPRQENVFVNAMKPKPQGETVTYYSTEVEQNLQEAARKSVGDYERMLENLESSKERIAFHDFEEVSEPFEEGPENYSTEITYDGWPLLWNFYSRLLPAKITLTTLGDLMNRSGASLVSLGGENGFRVKAFDVSEELAEKLRTYERQHKLGRTKKLSTGFPKERSIDKLTQGLVEKRFKDKYTATVRKSRKTGEHLEGALAALGLIIVKEYDDEHFVTMTNLGKEFYKLDNPVLKGDYSRAFFDDEVKFITEKLIPQRKLEDLLCKKALEAVQTFSEDKTGNAKVLNNLFAKEFKEFAESYNDNPNHKERLETDFIEAGISTDDNKKEKETPIEAHRVATMGRLSELGLVKWDINEKTSSTYQTDFNIPSKSYEPKEENAKKIDEYIRKHPECKLEKTRSIVLKRKKITLPVFKLPLDLLFYNIRNGRFASEYDELKIKEGRELRPDNPADAKKIQNLLLESEDPDTFSSLQNALAQSGQIESGIITRDGHVIDGNRRMAALQNLVEQGRSELDYLEVVRLPGDTSSTDVWKIEAGTQLGREDEEKT